MDANPARKTYKRFARTNTRESELRYWWESMWAVLRDSNEDKYL